MRIDYLKDGSAHLFIPSENWAEARANAVLTHDEVQRLYELLDVYLNGE